MSAGYYIAAVILLVLISIVFVPNRHVDGRIPLYICSLHPHSYCQPAPILATYITGVIRNFLDRQKTPIVSINIKLKGGK